MGEVSVPLRDPEAGEVAHHVYRIPCYGEADFCDKRVGIQSAPPFHGMYVVSVVFSSDC